MNSLFLSQDLSFLIPLDDGEKATCCCLNPSEPYLYIATNFCDVVCCSTNGHNVSDVCFLRKTSLLAALLPSVYKHRQTNSPRLSETLQVIWKRQISGLAAPGSLVTGMEFSLELDALTIALSTGQLILLHAESQLFEEVGAVDGGIMAMCWSPDGDALVAASGTGNLIMMNQDWELLSEAQLPGTEAHVLDVQITWRGDGKYFATNQKTSKDGSAQRSVTVWERTADGFQLHAVAEPASGTDRALTWQPNGRHLYVATQPSATTAQEPAQSTPASRQTLRERAGATAAVKAQEQLLHHHHTQDLNNPPPFIQMYERNGLKHGGFSLREPGVVEALLWSPDSELLAITQLVDTAAKLSWAVQIWHRSNWHWYKKFERSYPLHGSLDGFGAAPLLQWDNLVAGRFYVVMPDRAGCEQIQVYWDCHTSDRGTCCVVDGSHLLLTPLRHAVMPPPMCVARVIMPSTAVAVAVSDCSKREDEAIAAVMSDGRLALVRSVEADLWEETMQEQQAVLEEDGYAGVGVSGTLPPLLPVVLDADGHDSSIGGSRHVRDICWAAADTLVAVAAPGLGACEEEHGRGDVVFEYRVCWPQGVPEEDGLPGASAQCCVREVAATHMGTGTSVLRMCSHPGHGVLLQLAGGEVRHYVPQQGLATMARSASFPVPCNKLAPAPAPHNANLATPRPAVGLSAAGDLYWGSHKVASGVTSMSVRAGGAGGPALLFITRTSLLYTVYLTQLANGSYVHRELTEESTGVGRRAQVYEGGLQAAMHAAMRPDAASAAARDTVVRAVEQGAALVTTPRDSVNVVLQMPRGNLEGIAPRSLVLTAVADALDAHNYARAWDMCTTNRVDLNLIVDWAWPSFLSHAVDFVRAVPVASDLCDLMTALQSSSCCAEGGLYGNIPLIKPRATPQPKPGLGVLTEDFEDKEHSEGANAATCAPAATTNDASPGVVPRADQAALLAQGKVNAVCTALRTAVQALMSGAIQPVAPEKQAAEAVIGADGVACALPGSAAAAAAHELLSAVVTSYARSDPPQLGAALEAVRDAKEAAIAALSGGSAATRAGKAVEGTGPAERALRALLLHIDPDALYKVALGLYELPLAFMVITHAQKDPGEYAAELSRFAAIADTNLRRHAIDVHLERWEAALKHLVAAGVHNWDKALMLARERGLLRQLLALCDSGAVSDKDGQKDVRRRAVLVALGQGLEAGSKNEDAGLAYCAAGAWDDALRAYRAAGQWRQAMVMAGKLGYDKAATTRLAADMADELSGPMAQPGAAANLTLAYLNDVDNGVSLLARAKEWQEAIRVSYSSARPDLIPSVVAPMVAEAAAGAVGDAREGTSQVAKYWARLKDVRAKRHAMDEALKAAADAEGGAGVTQEELADGASEAGMSVLTGLSIYTENTYAATGTHTGASTRAPSTLGGRHAQRTMNKRAAKARKGRVRQGSPEEEASLVEHVLNAGPSALVLTEGGALCETLVMLGHESDARTLQATLTGWAAAHKDAVDDIKAHPLPDDKVPHAFKNILVVWQQPSSAPTKSQASTEVAWKWDIFRAS